MFGFLPTPLASKSKCSGPLDCATSKKGSYCCNEIGVCCDKAAYVLSSKHCTSNMNCPTDSEYYYCCSSSNSCCNYDSYQNETETQINHLIAAFTCASFFIIMAVCMCFACWKMFNARRSRMRPAPAASATSTVTRRSRTLNAPYFGDANINIININGADGTLQNTFEEQIINGRRILIELPTYDSQPVVTSSSNPPTATTDVPSRRSGSENAPPKYSPPPTYENLRANQSVPMCPESQPLESSSSEITDVIENPVNEMLQTPTQTRFEECETFDGELGSESTSSECSEKSSLDALDGASTVSSSVSSLVSINMYTFVKE